MKIINHFFLIAILFFTASCSSYKDIAYFQDIDNVQLKQLSTKYEAIIKKDDRLSIIVSGPDKLVVSPYNLTLSETGNGTSSTADPERSTLTYLVDPNGDIKFPILGTIHVEGMTRKQLVDYLTKEISKDVKDPVVYVSFRDYKITVLGEVRSPGTYTFDSEKISILQALGRAGDLQLTAQREDVLLIREEDGALQHHRIDLRSSDILQSPYFFLQQNDVIVVSPSPTRVATATTATGIWSTVLSSITTLIAILSLMLR